MCAHAVMLVSFKSLAMTEKFLNLLDSTQLCVLCRHGSTNVRMVSENIRLVSVKFNDSTEMCKGQ